MSVCKYCGHLANTTDEYGEDVCSGCISFFERNPNPPAFSIGGSQRKGQGVCAQCSCFVDNEELDEDESGKCRACRNA